MSSHPYKPGSLHIQETIGDIQSCDYLVPDPNGVITPAVHAVITTTEGLVTTFSGTTDETSVRGLESPYNIRKDGSISNAPVGSREWSVRGVGWSYLAYHRLTGSFSAQRLVPITTVVQILAGNMGIASDILCSVTLPDYFVSDNEPVSDALTRLVDLATAVSGIQHFWRIDSIFGTVTLQFFPLGTHTGPNVGTSGYPIRAGTVSFRVTRQNFSNLVVVKLDKYLKDKTQTDTFSGSDIFIGSLKLSFPLAGAPRVSIRGSSTDQTIGIKGIDGPGLDWYWNTGSSVIYTPNTYGGGTTIEVVYPAQDLRSYTIQDAASIASVGVFAAAVSGGDSSNSVGPASVGAAELARRDGLSKILTCQVNAPAGVFIPGQVCGVNVAIGPNGIASGNFFLRSLRQFDEEGIQMWRELELVQGPNFRSGFQMMGRSR